MVDEKIEYLLNSFENFHDSNFENISYDILNSEIQIILNAYKWDKPSTEESSQPHQTHLTITFKDVKKATINEIFSWDFIFKGNIEKINYENTPHYHFIDDENDCAFEIICKDFSYTELKINN